MTSIANMNENLPSVKDDKCTSLQIKAENVAFEDRSKPISCVDEAKESKEYLKGLVALGKEIKSSFSDVVTNAHKAHKAALALQKKCETPVLSAIENEKIRIIAWEKLSNPLVMVACSPEHAQEAIDFNNEMAEAVSSGDVAKISELTVKASLAAASVQYSVVPQSDVEGVSMRSHWTFRIIDESAIPRNYLIPDNEKLAKEARSNKDKASVPGIEFYDDKSIVVRT